MFCNIGWNTDFYFTRTFQYFTAIYIIIVSIIVSPLTILLGEIKGKMYELPIVSYTSFIQNLPDWSNEVARFNLNYFNIFFTSHISIYETHRDHPDCWMEPGLAVIKLCSTFFSTKSFSNVQFSDRKARVGNSWIYISAYFVNLLQILYVDILYLQGHSYNEGQMFLL
jgi:hypothetical protein